MPTTWDNLVAGTSGITRITRFDTIALRRGHRGRGEGVRSHARDVAKEVRHTGRDVHLGMAAAMEAITDSRLEVDEPEPYGRDPR